MNCRMGDLGHGNKRIIPTLTPKSLFVDHPISWYLRSEPAKVEGGGGTADNAKRPMALGEGGDKRRQVGNKCKIMRHGAKHIGG